MMSEDMRWDRWCAELDSISGDHYGLLGAIAECGELGWRSYFEDGFSPLDAFLDDLLHDHEGDPGRARVRRTVKRRPSIPCPRIGPRMFR